MAIEESASQLQPEGPQAGVRARMKQPAENTSNNTGGDETHVDAQRVSQWAAVAPPRAEGEPESTAAELEEQIEVQRQAWIEARFAAAEAMVHQAEQDEVCSGGADVARRRVLSAQEVAAARIAAEGAAAERIAAEEAEAARIAAEVAAERIAAGQVEAEAIAAADRVATLEAAQADMQANAAQEAVAQGCGIGADDMAKEELLDEQGNKLCVICMDASRNAVIAHGNTAHTVCCLPCANDLLTRAAPCPMCRQPIEHVLQNFG
jgi:hypothetical protein